MTPELKQAIEEARLHCERPDISDNGISCRYEHALTLAIAEIEEKDKIIAVANGFTAGLTDLVLAKDDRIKELEGQLEEQYQKGYDAGWAGNRIARGQSLKGKEYEPNPKDARIASLEWAMASAIKELQSIKRWEDIDYIISILQTALKEDK